MEWLNAPRDAQNMEVDIGYMPLMELKSSRPSVNVIQDGEDQRDVRQKSMENYDKFITDIKWTEEITASEAQRKIEIKMYPFKEVSII